MDNLDTKKIILYTVSDIREIFNLGRTKAYELMSADGFPSFKLNNRLYVEKTKLESWIGKRQGKTFSF